MRAYANGFQRAVVFISAVMLTFTDATLNGWIFTHFYCLQKK